MRLLFLYLKLHHIAVLDDVFFSFGAEEAALAGGSRVCKII